MTVTCGTLARAGTVNFTGFTGTFALGSVGFEYRGSVTLVSGMTVTPGTAGATVSFNRIGTASVDFTTAGKDLGAVDFQVTNSGTPGTVTLQGALTCTGGSITLNGGTLTTNNNNVTAASLTAASGDTLNLGSSTVTLNGSGTPWNFNSGATLNAGTSTIKLTHAFGTTKVFEGGGKTYYNFWNAAAGTVQIKGANTFTDMKADPGTINQYEATKTQTTTTFTMSGISGNILVMQSTSAGSQWTISISSGSIALSYVAIKDSNATGGATFTAANATNQGNNTGWTFLAAAGAHRMFAVF